MCDRIAILNDGQIAFVGTVAELTDQVGKHYTISIETKHGIEDFESDDIADTMLTLLEDFKKRKLAISDIKINRGTLEQHFIQIAKGEEK